MRTSMVSDGGDVRGGAYDSILANERVSRRRDVLVIGSVLAAVALCLYAVGLLDVERLAEGLPAIAQLVGEMMPPDFSRWQSWLRPLLDTLAMAVAGTALAVMLSLPLAFLAAPNTSPHPVVYRAARILLNFLRSVPELIMGIFFVAAVGFGALPGVLALGLHSVGMVGKFFAESIEHTDPKPIEAATAAGASRLQVIVHAVLPQVLPQLADTTIYRWEYNFRASTVLGVVGAGGIGFELIAALRVLQYDQVAAIMLCILGAVTVVDALGGVLRRRLK
jgi:phosphonate transport system permease protein